MIKEIVKSLIKCKSIDPNKSIKLIINIDQQTTKNKGYYNLHDRLIEELKYGIVNFDYSLNTNPVVFNDLEIKVSYQDSGRSYVVQAANLLAGTIRRKVIDNQENIEKALANFVDYKIILP